MVAVEELPAGVVRLTLTEVPASAQRFAETSVLTKYRGRVALAPVPAEDNSGRETAVQRPQIDEEPTTTYRVYCRGCGVPFSGDDRRLYCSATCHAEHPPPSGAVLKERRPPLTCSECARPFIPYRTDQKRCATCSASSRSRLVVRGTTEETDAWRRAAKAERLTISDWVRKHLNEPDPPAERSPRPRAWSRVPLEYRCCEGCENEYQPTHVLQRYCGPTCRSATKERRAEDRFERRRLPPRPCAKCGATFLPRAATNIYCGDLCARRSSVRQASNRESARRRKTAIAIAPPAVNPTPDATAGDRVLDRLRAPTTKAPVASKSDPWWERPIAPLATDPVALPSLGLKESADILGSIGVYGTAAHERNRSLVYDLQAAADGLTRAQLDDVVVHLGTADDKTGFLRVVNKAVPYVG